VAHDVVQPVQTELFFEAIAFVFIIHFSTLKMEEWSDIFHLNVVHLYQTIRCPIS